MVENRQLEAETNRCVPATGESELNAPSVADAQVRATAPAEQAEPSECPTPLGWKQVLTAFENESTAWSISFNGDTLEGRTWGTGPPLLFLPGLTATAKLYALLIWLLRDDFTCIVFDTSRKTSFEKSALPIDAEMLAKETITVADYHDLQNVNLFASGYGVIAALKLMRQHPERINKALLQSGYAQQKLSLTERLLISLGKYIPGQLKAIPGFRSLFLQTHRRWFPPFDASRWSFLNEEVGALSIRSFCESASLLKQFDMREDLPEIMQTVMLIQTEGDGVVLENYQQKLQAGLANVESEHLQGSGLYTCLTHPHRVAKLVRTFLLTDAGK